MIVASLVDLMCNEITLQPFVKRVNEDLRRDEMRIGPDLELRYFEVLSKILHYNRLKLQEEYKRYEINSDAVQENKWQPDFKNVMGALDRMSFTRVTVSVERLLKTQKIDDVYIPMMLFKEMVCYLRLLLQSSIEGHHEIAVAALYRLYYSSSDRIDPLSKLISDWRPGVYDKKHLQTLVELIHETMKTLDTAKNVYKNLNGTANPKKGKVKGKKELDLQQYIGTCMTFNVDEYFRRIVSNHSVRLYTKLLSNYRQNDAQTNHYIYCFFRRMCSFNLEQQFRAPISKEVLESGVPPSPEEEVNLGFMLFNIQTLMVFSNILNDSAMVNNKSMEPMNRLIKAVIRRLGEATSKNHLAVVEILFQHPRPQEHCCLIDNVYEAMAYMATGMHKNDKKSHNNGIKKSSDEISLSDSSSDGGDPDLGDEFDDNNGEDAKTSSADNSSPEIVVNKQRETAANVVEKSRKKQRKEPVKKRALAWTSAEDEILR